MNQDAGQAHSTAKSVRLLSERDDAMTEVLESRRRLLSSLAAIPILIAIAVLTPSPYEDPAVVAFLVSTFILMKARRTLSTARATVEQLDSEVRRRIDAQGAADTDRAQKGVKS